MDKKELVERLKIRLPRDEFMGEFLNRLVQAESYEDLVEDEDYFKSVIEDIEKDGGWQQTIDAWYEAEVAAGNVRPGGRYKDQNAWINAVNKYLHKIYNRDYKEPAQKESKTARQQMKEKFTDFQNKTDHYKRQIKGQMDKHGKPRNKKAVQDVWRKEMMKEMDEDTANQVLDESDFEYGFDNPGGEEVDYDIAEYEKE